MRPTDMMPGIPAAGHLSAHGVWHPNRADTCHRCFPPTPRREQFRRIDIRFDDEESGDA